jgi:hypothetical protein
MNKTALEALAALAGAYKSRDLAKLEALNGERRRLEAEIGELAGTLARDAMEGDLPFPMIAQRNSWAAAQIALRERRIAAIAIELAGVRAAARVSVGKHEALERLVAEADREDRAAQGRAEEIALVAVQRRGMRS